MYTRNTCNIGVKVCLAVISLLSLPFPTSSQSGLTTVTAIVKDTNNTLYAGGRWSAALVGATDVPHFTGAPRGSPPVPSIAVGSIDSSGNLSTQLADNNLITPSGTQWRFSITDKSGIISFSCTITITGASQVVTTELQACSAPLPAPAATISIVTGTAGVDFNVSGGPTAFTINLPTASGTNRGALSSGDWSLFNGKEAALTFQSPLSRSSNSISCPTCAILNGDPIFNILTLVRMQTSGASGVGSGVIRLANNEQIWSETTGGVDTPLIYLDSSNRVITGGFSTRTLVFSSFGRGLETTRLSYSASNSLVSGDFSLSASWGNTASVAVRSDSKDSAWEITITANGSGIVANPNFTLTFKNGPWSGPPFCFAQQVGGSLTELPPFPVSHITNQTVGTNLVTFIWIGTPQAGATYKIVGYCFGGT